MKGSNLGLYGHWQRANTKTKKTLIYSILSDDVYIVPGPNAKYDVTNDHGYVPLVVNTSQYFPHSRLITGVVTILTLPMPLVEHMSSPRVLVGFVLLEL